VVDDGSDRRVDGDLAGTVECRPAWQGAPGEWTRMPVAQFRYEANGTWTLYFGDRYGTRTMCLELDPRQPIEVIIKDFDDDPTGVFWG
jgi:Protein of unknown function (DUF3024)